MSILGRCVLLVPVLLAGCGYVGDPLPPALNIPGPVTGLRVSEQADKIVLEFMIPELTTEGLPLKLGTVDLRAGAWTNGPFDADAWSVQARPVETGCSETGPCRVEIPAREWVNDEVFFRARVQSTKERYGDWSEFAVLRVVPPLEPPSDVRGEAVAAGVQLTWKASQERANLTYRIQRRAGGDKTAVIMADVVDEKWVDTSTQYGTSYEYSVRAVVRSGEAEAVSELSSSIEITPEDHFPPSVPVGLVALAGSGSVELAWEANTEKDLNGYRLYRSVGNGSFERIADLLEMPSYSDRSVEPGKEYRYALSAVDQLGNESARCKPVEITVP